ncbi:hypothetical protein [Algoriphagus taiwanensis]|uniref:Uncharacterized protein n=1 Tax=Algoriphagus taiwanensis TaxID=1445656 RepID=A0ABQ6Q1H2_9BACT|nr:hypothetical protein Ataiwa_22050 [Algoriphagus taiwanensis]
MGKTVFTLLFLLAVCASAQGQNPIQIRENFFNNPKFFSRGQELSSAQVSEMLVPFAQEKRDFDEGIKQMKTGSGLKIVSFATLAVGLGVLFANADDPYAWRIPLITSFASVGLGFTGFSLRKKGYNRINSSIYRYNYQNNIPPPSASLGWTGNGLGLSFKF